MSKNDKCFRCLPSFIREWHSWKSWQKNSQHSKIDCFLPRLPWMSFPHETWQALKTFTILWHQTFLEFFEVFLDFPLHGGMIRAKTRMGTYQHFCHECKWHWHTCDVFPNMLVSYLHFSDLVWISYEVFKVTVKRSKGKSTRRPEWVAQDRWLLEIRGNPVECDTTRGIKPIIPSL